MKIRNATFEDCEKITSISKNDLGYKEASVQMVQSQFKLLDNSREQVFVAEEDGIVVGFIHIEKYNVLYSKPLTNILGLAVDKNYRRKKVGSSLLNKAEEWSKKIGAYGVRLNSGESRTEAHTFYRTQGYNLEKNQKRFLKIMER